MSALQILTAGEVEPILLDTFLRRVFPPLKSAFIIEHGKWLHRSNSNRFVILTDGQIAGYCAVIPTQVYISGQVNTAMWWVDLIIAPEFRGRGIQSLLDEHVRGMKDLLLGFPNKIAGIIHRKHGWVVREDMQVLMLPLRPEQVKKVQNTSGLPGFILRSGSAVLIPFANAWRTRLIAMNSHSTWRLDKFDAETMASVFMCSCKTNWNTTWRDAEYFNWRYGSAPQSSEYCFYLTGPPEAPTHYLVARHVTQLDGLRHTRILDIFGDFSYSTALNNIIVFAVQDAIHRGSTQISLLAGRPELKIIAKRLGFLFSTPVGFCWFSESTQLMSAFARNNYWVLADSDNDSPD